MYTPCCRCGKTLLPDHVPSFLGPAKYREVGPNLRHADADTRREVDHQSAPRDSRLVVAIWPGPHLLSCEFADCQSAGVASTGRKVACVRLR